MPKTYYEFHLKYFVNKYFQAYWGKQFENLYKIIAVFFFQKIITFSKKFIRFDEI